MTTLQHIKKYQKNVVGILAISLVAGLLFYAFPAKAAVRTWDNGGGDGLWSNCTNWSSNTCPTSSDIATFDGTSATNSTIDSAFAGNVSGVDINSGYTGTITQQKNLTIGTGNFAQDAGTFQQGTYTFDLAGSFSLNAGTFSAGASTNTIARNFTVGGSATLNASTTKIWMFDGGGDDSTFTYPGTFPGKVDLAKTFYPYDLIIASGTTINSMESFTDNQGGLIINNGATVRIGSQAFAGNLLTIDGTFSASSTIDIDRGGFALGSTGVFTYAGTAMSVGGNYTDNGGTFDESAVTVTFDGGNADSTFTYPGTFPGKVDLAKTFNPYDLIVASGTTINSMESFTGNLGGLMINNGATVRIGSQAFVGYFLTINGAFSASSTLDIEAGGFTLGSTGTFTYAGTAMTITGSYTDNGGTFDESGVTVTFDGFLEDSTMTYPGTYPGTIDLNKTHLGGELTIASPTVITNVASLTGNTGSLVVNSGAQVNLSNTAFVGSNLTIAGRFFASSSMDINTGLTLNSGGQFYYSGSNIAIEGNYTDNGATITNYNNSNITFDGTFTTASTVSCSSGIPFPLVVNKSWSSHADFTLSSGCSATSTTISTQADMIINGTLATDGAQLSPFTLSIGTAGKLRLYANQTMTTPTLSSGSLVDYYGTGTYTTLAGGSSYHHLRFSAGTYNLSGGVSLAGNLTTRPTATFNQTGGTSTFTGSSNTITGTHTFNNLTKSVSSPSTLTFSAGDTQTISGTLTLTGSNASNRLTLQSGTPTSQWYISPTGTLSLDYLAISDANNTSGTDIVCYGDVDCTDGGNNTHILFSAPATPPPVTRLRGGIRIRGGSGLY